MKRLDLQAIRGLAILLVLIFHLQPERCSLGFVGVDMYCCFKETGQVYGFRFFVLSGYLMAAILSKETFGKGVLFHFYSRRFRRIVPLYYVILAAVYTGTNFLLIHPDKKQLLLDIKWVVPFSGNIEPFFETHGYWDQVTGTRFLIHCWSLAVEIQFYLIAPYVVFAAKSVDRHIGRVALSIAIAASLSFQLLTPEKVSYDLLPSRIWQFLLGILCHFNSKEEGREEAPGNSEKLETVEASPYDYGIFTDLSLLFMVLLVLLNPSFPGKEHVFRLLSCLLIYTVTHLNTAGNSSILSSNFLIFTGDISYTMYLIHWPIIVAFKYFYNESSFNVMDCLFLISIVFLATVLLHHLIEKPLITSSITTALLTCILCVGAICATRGLYLNWGWSHEGVKINGYDIDPIINWNIAEHEKIFFPLKCDPDNFTVTWTNYTEDPNLRCQSYSNGTATIVVIGNSIAYRAFPKILEIFRGRYKELRLYARSAAIPLANDPNTFPEFTMATHRVVEKLKPDIVWNIHNHLEDTFTRPFDISKKDQDEGFMQFQENADFYSSVAKRLIIDLPYYWRTKPVAYEISKRLYLGYSNLTDLQVTREEVEKQQLHHRNRLLQLNCSSCVFIDVQEALFEEDKYYLFNRETYHAYTSDGNHFTAEMMQRVAPLYEKVIEQLLKEIS